MTGFRRLLAPMLAAGFVIAASGLASVAHAAADSTSATNPDAADAPPPVAAAPVPDPVFAELYKTCRDGASGDKGTYQRLEDAGWDLGVDGDTQTPYYQAFDGEKDFDGVGTADLTYSMEVYPTMTEGYCSISITTAQRKLGIDDLAKMTDLKGQVLRTDDGIASTWQDTGANPKIFIQADQHTKDAFFLLDVTNWMDRPAAKLPYVAPDNGTPTNSGD